MSNESVTFKGCVVAGQTPRSTSIWFPNQDTEQAHRLVEGGAWFYVPRSQVHGITEGTGLAQDEVSISKWWADKVGLVYDEEQVSRGD